MADRLHPKFGDAILNTGASESNPYRIGYYVETVRRKGRVVNPGTYLRLTDKRGDFWLHEANSERLSIVESEHPDTAKLRAVMEWLDEQKRAYPEDVDMFRPLSNVEQIRVNIAVSDLGVVRDRLSTDISRLWCSQLREVIDAPPEADRD